MGGGLKRSLDKIRVLAKSLDLPDAAVPEMSWTSELSNYIDKFFFSLRKYN